MLPVENYRLSRLIHQERIQPALLRHTRNGRLLRLLVAAAYRNDLTGPGETSAHARIPPCPVCRPQPTSQVGERSF